MASLIHEEECLIQSAGTLYLLHVLIVPLCKVLHLLSTYRKQWPAILCSNIPYCRYNRLIVWRSSASDQKMLKSDLNLLKSKQSLCIRISHIVLSKNATYHCNKLWLLLISYVQTDATLLAINSELCWMLHVSSVSEILRDGFVSHMFFKCDEMS